jgi:hypothetical protein
MTLSAAVQDSVPRRAEQEILQEARRVLRRLSAPRQVLFAHGPVHVVARSPASARTSRIRVAADLVGCFLARGWLLPDGMGRHVIAPAGQALVARTGPDGFGAQHRLMAPRDAEENRDQVPVLVNMAESPLARLKHRALIDSRQFAAGERLRRDYTLGQLSARMGVDWGAPVVVGGGGGRDTVSDIAIAARQRLNRALKAAGPGLGDLLFDVCCHLAPLEQVEQGRGWARRSARVVLMIALDRLAAHYGFDVVAGPSGVRAWRAAEDDERPEA